MKVNTDDLVSVTEIAQRCNITTPAVSNWLKRHADFPEPVGTWSRGRFKLWRWADVEAWLLSHPAPGAHRYRP